MPYTLTKVYEQAEGKKHQVFYLHFFQVTEQDAIDLTFELERIAKEVFPNGQIIHVIMYGYPPVTSSIVSRAIAVVGQPNFGCVLVIKPNGVMNYFSGVIKKTVASYKGFVALEDLQEGIEYFVKRFGPNTVQDLPHFPP